jgi:NAD(P)-dependent dehydrogenase (short-subunit alcohol dehydrogenase family)
VEDDMNISFEGQVALVTGASSGIGLATARAFAEAGAAVALVGHDGGRARRAAEELEASGHNVIAIECDVASEGEVVSMVQSTVDAFGRIDLAFNNAGIQVPAVETADAAGDEFDRAVAVNLRGVWNCLKYELRQMRTQGSGAIVNCSSQGGLVGIANLGAYTASKHGVLGMTKSAALEYAATGIRVNAICPGPTDTPMVTAALADRPEHMDAIIGSVPAGRLGRPDEIASGVLWLCSPGAGFVVGHALVVDGGLTAQ